MKKFLVVLLISILTLPCFALTLEGGVKQVERVRQDVFKDVQYNINTKPYKMYASKAPIGFRTDYSNGYYSITSGYKSMNYNEKGKLVYISLLDKDCMVYPKKLYRYSYPKGELVEVLYFSTADEAFIFDSTGKLIGISQDGVLKNGEEVINTIMKTTYFISE